MNSYDKYIFSETYKSFVDSASLIEGFVVGQKEDVEYDITDLANAYCEAKRKGDERAKNMYMSALIVRYWHMVPYLYNKSSGSVTSVYDVIEWVYDGIERACHYEAWNDVTKDVHKDPKGAEKCINQAITSSRMKFYGYTNKQRRSNNYSLLSLDEQINDKGETRYSVAGECDDDVNSFELDDEIKRLAHQGNVVEALILDAILFQDTFLVSSKKGKYIKTHDEDGNELDTDMRRKEVKFSKTLLYNHLRNMDDKFIKYFCERYDFNTESLMALRKRMKSTSSTALIRRGMNFLKNDEVVNHYAR